MQSIVRKKTQETPEVNFDLATGEIEIKGHSIPVNSKAFYDPLIAWLQEYAIRPKEVTKVNLQFDYFNVGTVKQLYSFFIKLEIIAEAGSEVHVNWLYEKGNEDMLEAGEDFQAITSVLINLIEIA